MRLSRDVILLLYLQIVSVHETEAMIHSMNYMGDFGTHACLDWLGGYMSTLFAFCVAVLFGGLIFLIPVKSKDTLKTFTHYRILYFSSIGLVLTVFFTGLGCMSIVMKTLYCFKYGNSVELELP